MGSVQGLVGSVQVGTAAVVGSVLLAEVLPTEWPTWTNWEKEAWRSDNADNRLEDCGWDELGTNVRYFAEDQARRQIAEIDHLVAKDGRTIGAEGRGRDTTGSSRQEIGRKMFNYSRARPQSLADGFMWISHASDRGAREIAKVKSDVREFARLLRYKTAWILDMTDDDCPTQIFAQ